MQGDKSDRASREVGRQVDVLSRPELAPLLPQILNVRCAGKELPKDLLQPLPHSTNLHLLGPPRARQMCKPLVGMLVTSKSGDTVVTPSLPLQRRGCRHTSVLARARGLDRPSKRRDTPLVPRGTRIGLDRVSSGFEVGQQADYE